MGQGSSTNNKQQQQLQKNDSVEQVESVEPNEDDDMSRIGSLKKNKWLRQKPNDEKPKKSKKNDKKKKKKDDQDEVSSATCISEPDRTSLRHSRIELHLEECQPAPDEDDAISLSSCGEDLQKNLKDIESEERPSLLNCDYSSSSVTASPGESLSSGQDSGFARGNTIHSVSSEEEHTETNHQDKKNSSTIGTKLITPTVEVTEKCQDYIEKSYPFNSCSPTDTPANSIVENQTKDSRDDSPTVSNLSQENICDAISSSTVPKPKLETQSSLTETPKIVSQTEVMKDTDLVTGMVKELVDETLESAVEYLTHEYKRKNNKPEFNEANQQESISEDNQIEEKTDKELYLSEVTKTSETEEKSKEVNETHMTVSDTLPEPFQDKVSGEGIDNKEAVALNFIENTEVNTTTEEDVIVTNKDVTDSLNQELGAEDISLEIASSTDPVNVNNVETIEKSGGFEELSYSLKVTSEHLEVSQTEKPEDESEKDDANEVETLQNCNTIDSNSSQLSTQFASNEENSMKFELSENKSSKPEILVETNQTVETKTICPSDMLTATSLDAEDSGANNSDGNLPSFSSDLNDASMTENSQMLNEPSSSELSTPEIITANEFHNNCTDSSSGSAASPQQPKDSKETVEQTPSNSTQPIPDNTTGAVFV